MNLKRSDWEAEYKGTKAAAEQMERSFLINKKVAEFLKTEMEKFPEEKKDVKKNPIVAE